MNNNLIYIIGCVGMCLAMPMVTITFKCVHFFQFAQSIFKADLNERRLQWGNIARILKSLLLICVILLWWGVFSTSVFVAVSHLLSQAAIVIPGQSFVKFEILKLPLFLCGVFFILEPQIEKGYIYLVKARLYPNGKFPSGDQMYWITNEIVRRFHNHPFALLTKERKKWRSTANKIGVLLLIINCFLTSIF